MPSVAERKSKAARHQHSAEFSEPLDKLVSEKKFYIDEYAFPHADFLFITSDS